MSKEKFEIGPDRFGDIRRATQAAKEAGFSERERREEVIKSVGEVSLDLESPEVKERAINKYWEFEQGSPEVPVVFVVPHVQKPRAMEMAGLLHEKYPDRDMEKIKRLVNEWVEAPEDERPHKVLSKDHPDWPVYRAIARLRSVEEPETDTIVNLAAEGRDEKRRSGKMIAKRSRMFGDPNRRSFFHKPRGVGEGKEEIFIQTKEYPTSVRASWYWAVEQKLREAGMLDERGELKKPFLQIAIHGMGDREFENSEDAYDIVVGGGSAEKAKSELADDEVRDWFSRGLVLKLAQKLGEEDKLRLAVDRKGEREVEVFEAGRENKVISRKVERAGAGLSGAGLGLESFRYGAEFEVADLNGNKREMKFPGFGENFNTIQLEVSRKVRKNPAFRQVVAEALGELASEFGERFGSE